MRWRGRRESSNVEDRRSQNNYRSGGKQSGILGLIILLIGAYYGIDLSGLVGTPDLGLQQSSSLNSQEEQELNSLSRIVLADTETVWGNYFSQNSQRYQMPTMVLYRGVTHTACGTGQSRWVPFTAQMIIKSILIYPFILI